ncbi:protein dachsous [Cyprinodon tularosa]|uniref:protein dachsous n=1 Tax=Cyprinodon tularosa TaxID=77115 RepID=UPI0018E28AA3|nr:protein dachsous [Cyprinodon tularosa]
MPPLPQAAKLEVTKVVRELFSGKALVVDEILPEYYKALDVVIGWKEGYGNCSSLIAAEIHLISSVVGTGEHDYTNMDGAGWSRICVALVVAVWLPVINGSPIGTTTINCVSVSEAKHLGAVDEEYSGDVELVTGIPPGTSLTLEVDIFDHLQFLELIYTPGESTATVRTKKPLDADKLADSDRVLYYKLVCGQDNKRRLTVNDINDNGPEFQQSFYNATVSEITNPETKVLQVTAVDKDSSPQFNTLEYSFEPQSEDFYITNTGVFRVKRRLNYNVAPKYNFIVTAKDVDKRQNTTSVEIIVTDYDNLNPYFSHSLYQATISENQDGQLSEITPEAIKAQDGDSGINMTVVYSISSVSPAKYQANFNINSGTGVLSVVTAFDREDMDSGEISVNIKAAQTDDLLKTAAAIVSVTVEDVNDEAPKFDQPKYNVSLLENSPADAVVFKAVVTDLDQGGFVGTLKILPESTPFSISPDGTVRVRNTEVLDREVTKAFVFQIEAKETDAPHHSATAQVTINLLDENDNSPNFTSSMYEGKVFANQTVGMPVVQVKAEDPDDGINGEIQYSIDFGNSDGYFSINGVTGEITLAKTIPLEDNRQLQFPLFITARDGGRLSRSASAQVMVTAPGTLKPQFIEKLYHGTVAEGQDPGVHILNVSSTFQQQVFTQMKAEVFSKVRFLTLLSLSATDPDDGANGRVTFSISKQDPPSAPAVFELEAASRVLKLAQPLNYSQVKQFTLTVHASDGGSPSLSGNSSVVVKVKDVNNNPPMFSKGSYEVEVSENLAGGASILTLEVTDADEGGFVGTLKILPESTPFSISPDGTVRVRNPEVLDREVTKAFVFQIEAKETDAPYHSATAQVTINLLDENDNSPNFTSSMYEGKVFANQTVGMPVVQVKAEDPDDGINGEIQYSIDFGNSDGYFSINGGTGEITLAKTIPLEDDRQLQFHLFITARDGGRLSRSASAEVMVTAPGTLKPHFLEKLYQGTVVEEQDPGVHILNVRFLAIPPETVTLAVTKEGDKFSISSSGEVKTKVKLDYDEAPHNYSVEISISDGTTSDTAVVKVEVTDINDNNPEFASNVSKSVPENAEVGSNVAEIKATDKDSGFNKEIRYSLRGGEGRFSIDPVSGLVSLAAQLDRETTAEYELLVVAEDQGRPARSATATLQVQVTDVNDNPPKFSEQEYQLEVLETESVGATLHSLSATDKDDGVNGRVTYSISQQDPPSVPAAFELEAASGVLKLAQPLNYSQVKLFTLTVHASDGGSPSLSGNSSVVVKVKDVNNNPPMFSKGSYEVEVSENLAGGASILTLEVTDADEGGFSNGHFVYTSDIFDINKQGVVSLKINSALDRETRDSYSLQVVAVDQASGGLSATAQLKITVLDYNDNSPQFPSIPYPLEFPEGDYSEEKPGEIFTIVPTDADIGPNGEVTLSLASHNPLFRFREDGMLLAVGSLDRESIETYDLVLKASDKGSPQKENIATIRVSLTDVNDERPQFNPSSYHSSILQKDAEKGKLLLTLSASDPDAGNNSLITYRFSEGNSKYLALNSETGEVTLTSDLSDVTEDTRLLLTAEATDHGTPPLSATARVMVDIRIASLAEGLAFQSSSYNFSLQENQPAEVSVGQVLAYSGSTLYGVSYALKTHTNLFSITSDGEILTEEELDKEQQEWYILEVEAVDTRTPPTSAVTLVRIHVEDVNEPPEFASEEYEASVFNFAPYKTPVIQVKAFDPDVGHSSALVYSLTEDSLFDVDPASGLVYVVSAANTGKEITLKVKATDPKGLDATATIKIEVQESASSSDVVTIAINRPANVVEKKVPELEKSLGKVLGWTVNIIQVWSSDGSDTRTLRASYRTLVSFVALDDTEAVSAEEVQKKLQSESDELKAELDLLFGEKPDFDVVTDSTTPASNMAVVIALGVLLGLSLVGLIIATVFAVRYKRSKKLKALDKESLTSNRHSVGYANQNFRKQSESSVRWDSDKNKPGDKETVQWGGKVEDRRTSKKDNDSLNLSERRNSGSSGSLDSAL